MIEKSYYNGGFGFISNKIRKKWIHIHANIMRKQKNGADTLLEVN